MVDITPADMLMTHTIVETFEENSSFMEPSLVDSSPICPDSWRHPGIQLGYLCVNTRNGIGSSHLRDQFGQ